MLEKVLINEIAWMGTAVSANDEWIELYNPSNEKINLDGWILKADDGSPEINLSEAIPALGFYLLERSDDQTIPEVPADLIYKGALGNNGENLKLYDNSGNLVDEVNCAEDWLGGDNTTKQTMEKIDSGWQTSGETGGTPKAKNSEQKAKNEEQEKSEIQESTEITSPQSLKIKYPAGVIFNEILASPEGADAENEWIEIFNQNDFEVNLANWQIKDNTGAITAYSFPAETKISALGFLVLKRPETKITLNNDGDGLTLFNPNGEIVDSITFGKSSLGQSYNKTQSGWEWSDILTPGKENIVSQKSAEARPRTNLTDEKQTEQTEQTENQRPGSLSQILSLGGKTSGLKPLFIGLITALFSGIVFLVFLTKSNFCDKLN